MASMRGGFLSLLGLGFILLAAWRAVRVRRDLARGETRWERAVVIWASPQPIFRRDEPGRFWCAIAVNVVIVLLLTLVAAASFRVSAFSRA